MALPTNAPIPAVTAIASAPQNVTRKVGLTIDDAPPAKAPIAPSAAKNINEAEGTTASSADSGANTAASVGAAAPIEKVMAEVRAATTGRASVVSEIPNSS